MKIVFLGAPGAGKGTYAKILNKSYDFPHISVGDLLRDALEKETKIGLDAKEYMSKGEFVPDEIVLELLKERLGKDDAQKGIFLDGFPRNIKQAKMLNEIVDLNKVLNFDVSREVVLDRLSGRIICKDCGEIFNTKKIIPKVKDICDLCNGELYQREDDKEETILKRLENYKTQTKPLEDFYRDLGILYVINSDVDIKNPECNIIQECKEVLDNISNKQF